ncbi:MAG: hypothetical protein HC888_06205 [Candidatus Competibacteraceae bacterium]|nr:hypothetical protein [Candidatus Competibacteraceae bacterium]
MWRIDVNPVANNYRKNKVTFFRVGSNEFIQVSNQSYMKSNLVMRGFMLSVMTEGFSDVFLSSFSCGWIASTQGKFELEHAVCTNDSEEEIRARYAEQYLIAEIGFDKRQQRIHEFSCVFLIDPRKQNSIGSIKRLRDEFNIDLDLPYEERRIMRIIL